MRLTARRRHHRCICDCSVRRRRFRLSRALPILENMGFTVVSERPYRIDACATIGREIWLQDFEMQRARRQPRSMPAERRHALQRCIHSPSGARSRRERRLQSPCRRRRTDLAPGDGAARVLPLPAADRRRLQSGVHGAGARLERRHHRRRCSAALRSAVRSGLESAAPRRRRRIACESKLGEAPGHGQEPRRRPHPATLRQLRSQRRCARTIFRPTPNGRADRDKAVSVVQARSRAASPTCRSRGRRSRSSSIRRASKACTCAWATSRAAAFAGRIGARTSAPKCSA